MVGVEWFAQSILGWTATSCNDVLYVTDHWAELSYFMAGMIKDILNDQYSMEAYEKAMRKAVPFIKEEEE